MLVERAKFAPHVMVLIEVCFGGKGRLYFAEERYKLNIKYYINNLLPNLLVKDCHDLLENIF